MISRVTVPGFFRATSVGSLRMTVASVSPNSPWTTMRSRSRSHRLREFRKNSRREPRRETWMISDMVGPLWRTCCPLHATREGAAGSVRERRIVPGPRVSDGAGGTGYLKRPSERGLVAENISRKAEQKAGQPHAAAGGGAPGVRASLHYS